MARPASVLRVAQLTDTHLMPTRETPMRGFPTAHMLEAVLADVRAAGRPDLILATGDLAEAPESSTYQLLREMLGSIGAPVWCLPGNHDDPALMRSHLDDHHARCPWTETLGGWRFILLDSHVPGEEGGRVGATQLQRLADTLARHPKGPTLVAVHHPPIALGSRWMDAIGLADGEALLETLGAYTQVRALLFGHAHQAWASHHGELELLGTPSTCVQFLPGAERFALDERPPGWRLLELHDTGRIETRVNWVPLEASASQVR